MNAAKPSEKPDRSLMNDQQAKRFADIAQAHRDELTERIAQAIRHDGTIEPLKGLHFNRSSSASECVHSVSQLLKRTARLHQLEPVLPDNEPERTKVA